MKREQSDRAANMAARFLPQLSDDESPAIDLAGVLVLAHIRDGELHVDLDLDTADPGVYQFYGDCQVPVRVHVQGHTVFEAVPCVHPTGAGAAQVRAA